MAKSRKNPSAYNSDMKKALLNAASSGVEPPEDDTAIGNALRRFVDIRSSDFDQDFVDDLFQVDANWLARPHHHIHAMPGAF